MAQPRFPEIEEEILKYWEEHKVFEKSLEKPAPRGDFVFYDGPPFATGLPHYGHILASTIKDVIPRYKTMRGYRVRRRWGWDCHGLPIENIVEQQMGISGKKQIEERGIDVFNRACREGVLKYVSEWAAMVRRIGRFVEFENSYKTMDNTFMESVWWALKSIWDKKLIYEGRKVLLYCPRCETPISNFEVAMDNSYADVTEEAVTVKFKLKHNPSKPPLTLRGGESGETYLLAWTTTPWTLPGNAALTVGEDIEYVVVRVPSPSPQSPPIKGGEISSPSMGEDKGGGEFLILAKARLSILGEGYEIVKEMKGKDLVGLEYEPLYKIPAFKSKKAFKVYPADFVNTEDGTGIVHTAVVYGEDDYNLGLKYKLPIVPLLDEKGVFNEVAPELVRGQYFKKAENAIKDDLRTRELLFARAMNTHSYPHCWRCNTKLLYNAIPAWFIKISKLKHKLLKSNEKINWYPEHLKHGRFKKGIEGAPDWNISRNRYWATPLPFWRCGCGNVVCIGSFEELKQRAVNFDEVYKSRELKDIDLHRPYIDSVKIKCEKCSGVMQRVSEVVDCWVESASMPFAEFHYPFENKEEFAKRYPADFVAEYIAQTRAWFYVMHVVGTAIFGKPPFKNVVTTGTIVNEKGEKLSKSKRNFPDPWEVVSKYGADSLRFYMMTSPVMQADNLFFAEREVDNIYKKVVLLTMNVLSFYKLYEVSGARFQVSELKPETSNLKPKHVLDRWIIARLHETIRGMTEGMDKYDVVAAGRLIPSFVDDLSTWYLRRSRERFKGKKSEQRAALLTTSYVLHTLSQLLAPFMPFLAEHIYQSIVPHNPPQPSLTLREGDEVGSVHLTDWPKFKKAKIDAELLEQMKLARKVVELAHAARAEAKIKVRQPLSGIRCQGLGVRLDDAMLRLIAKEVNVKNVVIASEAKQSPKIATASGLAMTNLWITKTDGNLTVSLNIELTPDLQKEGLLRELTRQINDARKTAGLTPSDIVDVMLVATNPMLQAIIKDFQKQLRRAVLARAVKLVAAPKEADWSGEITLDTNEKIWIGIVRFNASTID